jgi:hypothetical protein
VANITIISGGQSGVDRGALEAAVMRSIEYAGWCPKGGWAEDKISAPGIRADYPLLKKTPHHDPARRTRWNVRDSDAVLALIRGCSLSLSAGTELAIACAGEYSKPCLVLDLEDPGSLAVSRGWLAERPRPLRLNVAGPRESEEPGIGLASRRFILALFSTIA